jgi:hypothetical protein
MKEIRPNNSETIFVDDENYDRLSRYRWSVLKTKWGRYAFRRVQQNNIIKYFYMHRELTDAPPFKQVDHIDGNGLNNQRKNLRLCTNQENARNSCLRSNSTSGFKGVSWARHARAWRASLMVGGKINHIGYFKNKESAARAYDRKAGEIFKEFARPNFS